MGPVVGLDVSKGVKKSRTFQTENLEGYLVCANLV
jgi:hypothetical protein